MRSSRSEPPAASHGRKWARAPWARVLRLLLTAAFLAAALAAIAVAASGCGVREDAGGVGDAGTVGTTETAQTTVTLSQQETTTTVPSQTTTTIAAEETMTVRVYFSRDQMICAAARVIPETQQVGTAAMKELLNGPTPEEAAAGMVSNVPEGTTFLGLSINNGVATVDLTKEYASGGGTLSMMMRLAEVVFTLTQFPTVDGVNFKLDGEAIDVLGGEGLILDHPMTRADYEDLSPAILIESPTLGNTVGSPLRITGTANVFEAVFSINLVDRDGVIVADQVVTATSGTGDRGTFDVTVPFTVNREGIGVLVAFSDSAEDGSQINIVEIPLQLAK